MPSLTNTMVLDCGCGNGVWGYLIRSQKQGNIGYIVGLDIYRGHLEFCKKYNVYDDLILGDASKPPFKNSIFDVILACQVIEHLDKGKGFLLLNEMERICKGRIIVTTHNGFMLHEDEVRFQIHRSGWFVRDFKKVGWRVRGIGFLGAKPFFGREEEKARFLWGLLFYLFTPMSYIISFLGDFLIAVKDINRAPSNQTRNGKKLVIEREF